MSEADKKQPQKTCAVKIPSPHGAPWRTSKLFFKPDVPGSAEMRNTMRWACGELGLDHVAATALTWAWLVSMHGGDEQ